MSIQELHHIHVTERHNAPETTLYVKVIATNTNSLTTKPYAFILPGGPGANHSSYQDYECLQTSCNVVFHDPRGCGLSSKEDPRFCNMDTYVDDIDAIRQHLQLTHLYLVGKSYGAMCALAYIIHYPKFVAKLVLAAGAPSYRFIATAKANFAARNTTRQQQVLCEKLWRGGFNDDQELADYLNVMAPHYSYKKRHGKPTNRAKPLYPHAHEPLNQGFSDFLNHFNFESRLHEIHCKTLILAGYEDWITDKMYSEQMADAIPDSQLIIFQHADHSMETDVPELYFEAIQTFLAP